MDRPSALVLVGTLAIAMLVAACGGGGDGGDGPGNGPGATGDVVTSFSADEESEPTSFVLAEGRYRVSWRHTCDEITVVLQGADGTAEFEETSRSKAFSKIRSNVPRGEYQLLQTNDACTDWEIRIDKM